MRTETIEIYTYAELSEKAREKALRDYSGSIDYDWSDSVYEDAMTIASLIGVTIDKIAYTGFYSQGDGARFTGYYNPVDNAQVKVKEHAPTDESLHRIAAEFDRIRAEFTLATVDGCPVPAAYYALISAGTSNYCHEYTMVIDIDTEAESLFWDLDNAGTHFDKIKTDLKSALRSYAKWIYKQLELEWEYLTSEDSFKETCEANNWEFTVNGEMY